MCIQWRTSAKSPERSASSILAAPAGAFVMSHLITVDCVKAAREIPTLQQNTVGREGHSLCAARGSTAAGAKAEAEAAATTRRTALSIFATESTRSAAF